MGCSQISEVKILSKITFFAMSTQTMIQRDNLSEKLQVSLRNMYSYYFQISSTKLKALENTSSKFRIYYPTFTRKFVINYLKQFIAPEFDSTLTSELYQEKSNFSNSDSSASSGSKLDNQKLVYVGSISLPPKQFEKMLPIVV